MTVFWIYRKRMLELGLIPFGPGHRRDGGGAEWLFMEEKVPSGLILRLVLRTYLLKEARLSVITQLLPN